MCEALWGTAGLGRSAGGRDKTTLFYFNNGHTQNDSTESQKTHNTTMLMTSNEKSETV